MDKTPHQHVNKANAPSDFKTYKGRVVKHDSDDESSGGEEVVSEVSDGPDDELFEDTLNYKEQQEILNGKLESIAQ